MFRSLLLLLLASCASFRGNASLQALVDKTEALGASVSLLVVNGDDGRILFSHRPNARSQPASVMKLVTTLFALETLGPDFRFTTKVMLGPGDLKNGTLSGDLCIDASGDPSFASDRIEADPIGAIADRIALLGASVWQGGLGLCKPDEAPLLGPGWAWDDAGLSYSARPSEFVAFENKLTITLVSDGTTVSERGDLSSRVGLQIKTTIDAAAEDLECRRLPLSTVVNCTLPPRATVFSTEVSVDDPLPLVSAALEDALAARAITWQHTPFTRTAPWRLLHESQSPPLSEIARITNQASVNIFAERLALSSVKEHTYAAWQLAASRWLVDLGIPANDITIVDGSGLSRYNAISARAVIALLKAATTRPAGPIWLSGFAIAGTSGTLKRRGLDVRGYVFAKSGTLSHYRALAGVAYGRGALLFTLLVANHPGTVKDTNQVLDALMTALTAPR